MLTRLLLLLMLLTSFSFARGYQPFLSFSASASAMNGIYSKHKILPISGRSYYFSKGDCSVEGLVDIKKNQTESVRWRHLIPEAIMGQGMECMTKRICQSTLSNRLYSGAGCCRKVSPRFKKLSSDLFNVIPTVLQEDHKRLIKIGTIVHKGDIARSYLYLIDTYGIKVERKIKELCKRWHKKYPVSTWEREKNRKIFKLQGTFNPYIEKL